jgi:hypothetical protein
MTIATLICMEIRPKGGTQVPAGRAPDEWPPELEEGFGLAGSINPLRHGPGGSGPSLPPSREKAFMRELLSREAAALMPELINARDVVKRAEQLVGLAGWAEDKETEDRLLLSLSKLAST